MAEFDHGIKMITDTAGRQLARLAGWCRRVPGTESEAVRECEEPKQLSRAG